MSPSTTEKVTGWNRLGKTTGERVVNATGPIFLTIVVLASIIYPIIKFWP